MLTLRELCEETGVSRRAIQGYEAMGLLKPAGYNKMGHLLYQPEAADRVRQIRFYQEIGFALKEIVILDQLPEDRLRGCLLERRKLLKTRQKKLERELLELDAMIAKLNKEDQ